MNVLDLVRKARPEVPEVESDQRDRARAQLLDAITQGSAGSKRRWWTRRMGFLGLLAAGAIPIGIAVAGSLGGEVSGDSTPTEACPIATAAFTAAGLQAPTEYGPDGCPDADRLREWIATLRRDVEIREALDSATGD